MLQNEFCFILTTNTTTKYIMNDLRRKAAKGDVASVAKADPKMLLGTYGDDDNTLAHDAAFAGRGQYLNAIFAKLPALVHARNKQGNTPLHFAAVSLSLDAVKACVSHGAVVDAANEMLQTPLHVTRTLDMFKYLLASGADPLKETLSKTNVAHRAAREDATPILRFLERDPKLKPLLSLADKNGSQAIHYAAKHGHKESVALLHRLVPNCLNAANHFGETAPFLAVSDGRMDVLLQVIELGCDLTVVKTPGLPLLHWAVSCQRVEVLPLLAGKIDCNVLDHVVQGTALLLAAANNDATMTSALLEIGVDPDLPASDGTTPAMHAAKHGNNDILAMLHVRGYNADAVRPRDGLTAMLAAVHSNHPNTVALLESHGCDVNARFNNRRSALGIAIHIGNVELVRAVLLAGWETRYEPAGCLVVAMSEDKPEILTELLNAGLDGSGTTMVAFGDEEPTAMTPSMLAVRTNRLDFLKILRGAGVPFDTTLAEAAVESENIEMIDYLWNLDMSIFENSIYLQTILSLYNQVEEPLMTVREAELDNILDLEIASLVQQPSKLCAVCGQRARKRCSVCRIRCCNKTCYVTPQWRQHTCL